MQHELDWLSRYLDKKGIDLIVLYQLSVKEIIKYLRLSPFQRKCFNGIYCSCLSDFTYNESNENESIEENSNANDQVTGYNEQIESNSNDTYVPEVKETPQPEDNGEREIILVPETIPACDDTIPYGAYTSYDEANSAAKAALREAAIRENWFSSHYGIDTHQTECGTIYYTYWYEEFVGN